MILSFVHLILLGLLCWQFLRRVIAEDHLRQWLWVGLGVRVIAGLSFGVIYTYYIGNGDTRYFFDQANELNALAKQDFFKYCEYLISQQYPHFKSEARNGFFVKILSVFSLVSNHNYWVTTLYFSVFSYFIVASLVKTFVSFYPSQKQYIFVSFLLIPSPIFWTAGIMKDTLVFSLLMYMAIIVLMIHHKQKIHWLHFISISLCVFMLWKLRHFTAAIAVLALCSTLTHKIFKHYKLNPAGRSFGWVALMMVAIFFVSLINRNLNLGYLPEAIFNNYQTLLKHSKEINQITFTALAPYWIDLVISFPKSLITGLYRPFIWEGSPFLLLHKIENLILVMLSVWSLRKLSQSRSTKFIVLLPTAIILVLAMLMPLAAPNFGTLVRYKAIYLPFLFYFLLVVTFNLSRNREI